MMASSFYDANWGARGHDSEVSASFKIRQVKGYKPDISAMKSNKDAIGKETDKRKDNSPIKASQ